MVFNFELMLWFFGHFDKSFVWPLLLLSYSINYHFYCFQSKNQFKVEKTLWVRLNSSSNNNDNRYNKIKCHSFMRCDYFDFSTGFVWMMPILLCKQFSTWIDQFWLHFCHCENIHLLHFIGSSVLCFNLFSLLLVTHSAILIADNILFFFSMKSLWKKLN